MEMSFIATSSGVEILSTQCENLDAFIAFRSSQPRNQGGKLCQKRSSFAVSEQSPPADPGAPTTDLESRTNVIDSNFEEGGCGQSARVGVSLRGLGAGFAQLQAPSFVISDRIKVPAVFKY
jgi:hypothetical protein